MFRRKLWLGVIAAVPLIVWAEEKADLSAIQRIKTEAFENSKVMDHAWYLTDVYGGRVTNSPGYRAAADWAVTRLKEYGLSNVALEKWPFGRGWSYSHFYAAMTAPQYMPLIGFPLAWSSGTNGPISGEPMIAVIRTDADMAKWKGKLKGRIVMTEAPRDLTPIASAPLKRYSDQDLGKLGEAPEPGERTPMGTPRIDNNANAAGRPPNLAQAMGQPPGQPLDVAGLRRLRARITKFLREEGVTLAINMPRIGDGGTVFGQSAGREDAKDPMAVPTVAITAEHYNRIARLLEHKIPVKVEFDIKADSDEKDLDSANVIAEIPGGKKKDEIVMVGAHLDSWHGGTGATDNAAGCAVAMEAMRILKASGVKLDRTVRMGLWGGEEEGLLGSKAYVKAHFADPEVMKPLPEHAKLSAYYNLDNGTGKIRGIYLQGLDMERPIFETWMAPFKDLGMTTVSIRNTGGTDHLSFAAVGLPGFQFIQDEVEYNARTHHSNMDVYDRLQKSDLMQASAIMASFIYQTANREEMMPRKPLPKPQPAERQGPTTSAETQQKPSE